MKIGINQLGIAAITCLLAVSSCSQSAPSTDREALTASPDDQIISSVDSRGAKALLDEKKDIILIDVRTPEEYAEGHLEGAINIDFQDPTFAEQLRQLEPEQKYMLYCVVGGRSGKSQKIMEEMGFKEVYNVSEGFEQLRQVGIPASTASEQSTELNR